MSLSFWPISLSVFIASCMATLSSSLIPIGMTVLYSACCNNLIYRRALESQRTKGTAMEQLRLFSLEETISYTPAMEQLRLR